MSYLGDFAPAVTLDFKFTTRRFSTGAPFALASGAISVYKDNSTTQSTTGVTLTADFDSVTGLNNVRIDTSADGSFYAAGSNFQLVITTGTVDSVSVVGEVLAQFSLNNRSALRPTVAARTLDVSAGGEAGVDWANIGSPTTAQNLSATNIDVDQVVASVSGAVGSVTGGATAAALATAQTSIDDLPTNAELATALAAADDAVLAQIALVKAKTDPLTFTVANQVNVNIQYVNDVEVTGVGTAGSPWGPV